MTNGTAELSELERLKLENYALKYNMLQTQLQQIAAERQAYLRQLVADHPGYVWNEAQGVLAAEPQ